MSAINLDWSNSQIIFKNTNPNINLKSSLSKTLMILEQETHNIDISRQPEEGGKQIKQSDCSGTPVNSESTQLDIPVIDKGECWNQFCSVMTEEVFPGKYGDQTIWFCKNCIKLYLQKNCCYFCAQVYSDDDQTFLDGKKWVQCDQQRCGKWMHVECESRNSIPNINQLMKNRNYKYKCPWCRLSQQTRKEKLKKKLLGKTNSLLRDYSVNEDTLNDFQGVTIKQTESTKTERDPIFVPPPVNTFECIPKSLEKIEKQVFLPIMGKNVFFEELLKKYGTSSPYVQQDDALSDLVKIRSLIK